MLELFIALFGGLYWACKLSGDKSTVRSAQRDGAVKTERIMQRQALMKKMYVDLDLEADMAHHMYSSDTKQMREDFAKYGVDTSALYISDLRHLHFVLSLAKLGKVFSSYTESHKNILGNGFYDPEPHGTEQKAIRDARINCLLAIESELISHGIDPCFIFLPTTGFEGGYSWAPASPVRLRNIGANRYRLGKVWMLCASYYDENLQDIFKQ